VGSSTFNEALEWVDERARPFNPLILEADRIRLTFPTAALQEWRDGWKEKGDKM
jgi:hypothetical protein